MSTNQKTWTVGEALTQTELQRDATIGANMDDRAYEGLATPGLVQKKIFPLAEETLALNARLLAIPSPTNGAVRVQPAMFVAGSPTVATAIAMTARQLTALDSALFASNSSGSTRYDLLYATVNYFVSATGSRKIKDVNTAIVSTQSLNLEQAPQVVLTILPNVGNVTPTATMPADGTLSFNFPVALITLANGFTSGSAISSANITPLWSGGWVPQHRVRGMRPMSFFYGSAAERPGSVLQKAVQNAERWGSDERFFCYLKVLNGTPTVGSAGLILDSSIDWRNRFLMCFVSYLGSGVVNAPLEGSNNTWVAALSAVSGSSGLGLLNVYTAGGGADGSSNAGQVVYHSTNSAVVISADATTGNLLLNRNGALQDNTNGDVLAIVVWASDRLVTTV